MAQAKATKTASVKKATPKKTAPGRRRQRNAVDDRTATMTAEALTCRSWGHAPTRMPVPPNEQLTHKRKGQLLVLIGCRNHCGYHRRLVLDLGTAELISATTKYEDPKGYLVQRPDSPVEGQPRRLSRQASRQAFITRLLDT
jgi:hypothetical protein